jgi:alkylhydroperoxidase/carboxymuconolactone decarboxylase family protein YurZ
MATDQERQAYIDNWASGLGDDLPTPSAILLHKVMAKYDLDVEMAYSGMTAKIQQGPLDAKTLQLLYVLGYTIRGFRQENIAWHVRAALRAGATAEEVLHALELVLSIDGVVPFMRGVEAWVEATGAEGIEPTNPIPPRT